MDIPYNRIFNRSVERVILASLIFQPELIDETSGEINRDDFYIPFNREVYEVLVYLENSKSIISEELIQEELERREKYNEDEFFNIFRETPIANLEHYIKELKNRSIKRQLLQVAKLIEESVFEQDMDSFEILNSVESKIYNITQDGYVKGFRDSPEIVESTKDYIKEMSEREDKEVTGLNTGFAHLNKMTTGFNPGELIILAARPAMGKTAFALNVVNTVLQNRRGVAFFSLEMPAEQLMLRLLSIESQIPLQEIRTGNLNRETDWNILYNTLEGFKRRLLFVDDDGNVNINQLRTKLRKLKSKHQEIDLAVIDYLQIMSSAGSKDRQMEVSEISRGLKLLARELEIPIIALSQLNRSLESRNDKRPIMSDIRESGCLTGDSLVLNAETGKRVRIDEVFKNRDNMLPFKTKAMGENLQIGDFDVTNAFYSGEKTVYKLKTKSGRTIKATANHKFYRVDGWFRLDELNIGEKIATPEKVNIQVSNNSISDNEIILLAHLIGDGSILPNQPYRYTSGDMKNIEIVKKVANELFNIDGKIVKQENWWNLSLRSPNHLTHNVKHPITIWFEKLKIERVRSYEKVLPESIFELNSDKISLFLKHLWATDGSITKQGNSLSIYYASISQQLSKQVQSLLLRLGIISTLRVVKQVKRDKEYRDSYSLHIQGKENQEKFLKEVNSFGVRGDNREEFLEFLSVKKANPNNGTIDKVVWETFIKKAKEDDGISWREFAKKLDISYSGSNIFKNGISKERMKKISEIFDNKDIGNLANSDVYWDEIVSIEELGVEKTYDMTVDTAHNFISEDIIVHNSIEQDADVILFVYRDDVYRLKAEKEKEKEAKDRGQKYSPNYEEKTEELAEIIIGKQRNGPTGNVKLNFQKQFTRFVNFEDLNSSYNEESAPITRSNFDNFTDVSDVDQKIDMPIL